MRAERIVQVASIVTSHGNEFVDYIFKNPPKIIFNCKCGESNNFAKSWKHYLKNPCCDICMFKKNGTTTIPELSLSLIKESCKKNNCQFVESKKVKIKKRDNSGKYYDKRIVVFICSCGEKDEKTHENFLKGPRCVTCGNRKKGEAKIGINHPLWRTDREEMALEISCKKRMKDIFKRMRKLFGAGKNGITSEILGYSAKMLLERLRSHENWTRVDPERFEIDHIFPVAAFFLYGIKDPKIISALDNLQPLSPEENNKKNDSFDRIEFEKYLTERKIEFKINN